MLKYADLQIDLLKLLSLRRVSRSWHCSISTVSRLWEKYQQTGETVNGI